MRRQTIEIDADILKVIQRCGGHTGVTAIVYGANLNFKLVKKYLARLIARGLLVSETKKGRELYSTTEKAPDFLDIYHTLGAYNAPREASV